MVLETRLEALVGFPLTEAFQEEEIAINQSSELRNAGDASGGQVVIDLLVFRSSVIANTRDTL